MIRRAPRALSPAQRDVIELAERLRVRCSAHGKPYWWTSAPDYTGPRRISPTVEALIRAGLLETGPFVALGTPRLAVVTDAGKRMLAQIREREAQS